MLIRRSLTLLALAGALLLVLASGAAADSRFGRPAAAALPGKHLLDVGVVDYDGDGFLDLFTTNHKFHSALLRNDGAGGFVDELAPTGLSPSPAFPGLEIMRPPAMGEDGLYVYISSADGKASRSYVHIRAVGTTASGKLTFASKAVDVERDAGADVHVGRSEAGQPSVEFEARPGAVIDIATRHIDLPIAASFDGLPARQIRVGSGAVRADETSFLLTLRDRHGLAFADIGGDRATDVFAVSGGLGGGIKLPGFRGQVQDEMLIRRNGRFSDEAAASGLLKGALAVAMFGVLEAARVTRLPVPRPVLVVGLAVAALGAPRLPRPRHRRRRRHPVEPAHALPPGHGRRRPSTSSCSAPPRSSSSASPPASSRRAASASAAATRSTPTARWWASAPPTSPPACSAPSRSPPRTPAPRSTPASAAVRSSPASSPPARWSRSSSTSSPRSPSCRSPPSAPS